MQHTGKRWRSTNWRRRPIVLLPNITKKAMAPPQSGIPNERWSTLPVTLPDSLGLATAHKPARQSPRAQTSRRRVHSLRGGALALYPDPLVSQILVASTYPLELVQALQWLQRNPGLMGAALTQAAQLQNWDPSIQALVVFPDLVKRLNQDITWTTNLGNAFLSQQGDVMDAVQRMRFKAQQSGKLSSTSQQTCTTTNVSGQPVIEIEPANPQIIYLPQYVSDSGDWASWSGRRAG